MTPSQHRAITGRDQAYRAIRRVTTIAGVVSAGTVAVVTGLLATHAPSYATSPTAATVAPTATVAPVATVAPTTATAATQSSTGNRIAAPTAAPTAVPTAVPTAAPTAAPVVHATTGGSGH